jgi:hypothetical protein
MSELSSLDRNISDDLLLNKAFSENSPLNTLTINKIQNFGLNLPSNIYLRMNNKIDPNNNKMMRKSSLFLRNPSINPLFHKYNNYLLRRQKQMEFYYLSSQRNKISDRTLRHDFFKLTKAVLLIILILSLYIAIYYRLIRIFYDVYNNYRFFIIKVWLIPASISFFILGFTINFLTNLFYAYMCVNYYTIRKSQNNLRLFFKYIMPKHVVYMFKIKNFINRYYTKIN